jgi:hypothetical protein
MLRLTFAILLSMTFAAPATVLTQARGTPTQTPTPTPAPQRGQRGPAKPPMQMTLKQVAESLLSLKNSARVEELISKANGVQFQATPAIVDILKQLGARSKLISMIPPAVAPPPKLQDH